MFKVTEHNVSTGEVIVRNATQGEIEQLQKDIEKSIELDNAIALKKEQKNQLLNRLGITEQEAELLLS